MSKELLRFDWFETGFDTVGNDTPDAVEDAEAADWGWGCPSLVLENHY